MLAAEKFFDGSDAGLALFAVVAEAIAAIGPAEQRIGGVLDGRCRDFGSR